MMRIKFHKEMTKIDLVKGFLIEGENNSYENSTSRWKTTYFR